MQHLLNTYRAAVGVVTTPTNTTRPTDWQILRGLLAKEYDRLAGLEEDPQTGVWMSGMRHGMRSALAYMDGIEQAGADRSADASQSSGVTR